MSSFAFGSDSKSKGKSSQPLSLAQARQTAQSLQAKAERQEAAGDMAEAFLTATTAWELVRAHPDDAECQRLEGELFPLVQRCGEAAEKSSRRRDAFSTAPLRIK